MKKDLQAILSILSQKAGIPTQSFLNEETYFLAIESAYNMIIITDKNAVVQYANPAVERITGYSRNEVLGKKTILWGGLMDTAYFKNMWEIIQSGEVFSGEIKNHRKNGDTYIAHITISPIKTKEGIVGYIGTEEDITLQKELLKEKEEFVSMASHQLRTPLGSMKWNIELLQEDFSHPQAELATLAAINQGMIDMVNNLLATMRIRDNRLVIRYEQAQVQQVIKEALSNLAEKINEKKLTLKTLFIDEPFTASIDKMLLKEIVANLIDNAIKYSPEGKVITLQTKKQGKNWTLRIIDQGMGISQSDLKRIQDKFYRSKNVTHIKGSGLGLYIVKSYLQKMKGSLVITSKLHKGTTVECLFPMKQLG
jgi:PAS domain S-box-containing protein